MTAISLHLGLNRIDPTHYGTAGTLLGCENDASCMQSIASKAGFATTCLLNEEATSVRLLSFLSDAAKQLKAGDTLLLTYSGHGAQTPDLNHDEAPGVPDDTWCTFDRMVIDDELGLAWTRFDAGVRIILVSDSCHSATMAKTLMLIRELLGTRVLSRFDAHYGPLIGDSVAGVTVSGYRTLPLDIINEVNRVHYELYADIQRSTPPIENADIPASVITLAACRDGELASDGKSNGVFTKALLDTWNYGAFAGSYRDFIPAIRRLVKGQIPNYCFDGAPNAAFQNEKPFTIGRTMPAVRRDVDKPKQDTTAATPHRWEERTNASAFIRMELDVPREFVTASRDADLLAFLRADGSDALMKAISGSREIVIPEGIDGSAECRVDHSGPRPCYARVRN